MDKYFLPRIIVFTSLFIFLSYNLANANNGNALRVINISVDNIQNPSAIISHIRLDFNYAAICTRTKFAC